MRPPRAPVAGIVLLAVAASAAVAAPAPATKARSLNSPSPAPTMAARAADAAGAQAIAQALRLPPGALARVAAHAALVEARGRQAGGDPHPACALLASADALRAALFDGLAPRLAEAGRDERHMAREQLAGLATALPGVGARLPLPADAALEAGVDHAALAAVLPAGAPGAALLAVAGGLRDPAGAPAYLRPALPGPAAEGAGATCADFGRVLGPLARLPGAWQAAPACLRARLRPALREAVVRMGEQADFCRDEAASRGHAREAARLLASLPAFGGPGTGKRIGHNFRSYGLRFDLAP